LVGEQEEYDQMANENEQDPGAALTFEGDGRLIRRQWHNGAWYCSVIDVVGLLAETSEPRRYWSDFKRKMAQDEGFGQLHEKIVHLKMRSLDGKAYATDAANQSHYDVGRKVCQTIAELGGTMPERLPTPSDSIQQVRQHEQQRIESERRPSLFGPNDANEP